MANNPNSNVFQVPASEGTKRRNQFPFRADGKIFHLPRLQYLTGESSEYLVEAWQQDHSEAVVTRRLIAIECPEAVDAVRKMRDDQVIAIAKAWQENSTASVGESNGSEG